MILVLACAESDRDYIEKGKLEGVVVKVFPIWEGVNSSTSGVPPPPCGLLESET
jgi:hypothetical protein